MNHTCKEICEAYIKFCFPDLSQEQVEKEAKDFYEASPTGELFHVFAAAEVLKNAGVEGF